MRHLLLALGLLLAPALARAEPVVLAAHPVAAGLAQSLLRDTGVGVETVVPGRLPASRQQAYFSGRGDDRLAEAARAGDAVVSLRSVWPEDPLYPLARRINIRLVEIDAARPIDGALPGLATVPGDTAPWLAPTNAGRMADILAADLRRLYPEAADGIDANLATLRQALRGPATDALARLARLPDTGVVSLSDRFPGLAADLGLDIRATILWDVRTPSAAQLAELTDRLRAEDVAVVLHHLTPAAPVVDAIHAAGARLAVLDSLETGAPADVPAVLATNARTLLAAFEDGATPTDP